MAIINFGFKVILSVIIFSKQISLSSTFTSILVSLNTSQVGTVSWPTIHLRQPHSHQMAQTVTAIKFACSRTHTLSLKAFTVCRHNHEQDQWRRFSFYIGRDVCWVPNMHNGGWSPAPSLLPLFLCHTHRERERNTNANMFLSKEQLVNKA